MLNRWTITSPQALQWLVVLIAIGLPRITVLGALPSTDEGIFAYFSQIIFSSLAAGHGLPDTGTLMFYPMLLSWVFDLSLNHIMFLRLIDLIVTLAAGLLFYKVIERESRSCIGAALISTIFLFIMNQPLFIQSGFKNSIFAAYIPLFIAMLWVQNTAKNTPPWLWIGVLGATSVLLRETFIPFLVVGAISILISHGWRTFIRFSLGVVLGGAVIVSAVLIARGGIQSFFDAYINAGDFYASMKDQTIPLLVTNGILSAKESIVPLGITGLAIFGLIFHAIYRRKINFLKRFLFWASIALVPLLEPLSKIGFPYHFAVCLPGLAGLCALAWEQLISHRSQLARIAITATFIAICTPLLLPKLDLLSNSWTANKENLEGITNNAWRPEAITQSNYLLAAEAILKAAPPHGTLSISGFMFSLFPLTGLLPPAYESNHLNAMAIKYRFDEDALKSALESCPPDVLMTTSRTDLPGSDIIRKAIESSTLYTAVATIPVALEKSYGTFGGTVYKRTGHVDIHCEPLAL